MKARGIRMFFLGLLVIGVVLGGYFVGERGTRLILETRDTPRIDPEPGAPSTSEVGDTSDGAGLAQPAEGPGSVDPNLTAPGINDADLSPTTAEGIIERLDDVLAIEDYDTRRYRFEVLFDAMTANQAPEVYAALRTLPRGPKEDQLKLFFFGRWGYLDGPAAIEETLQFDGRRSGGLTATVLTGWSQADARAAWNVARQLVDGWPRLTSRIGGVITELARIDLSAAIAARNEVNDERAERVMQGAVIDIALEEERLDAVLAEVLQFESIEEQKSWIGRMFRDWGQAQTEAPLRALESIADPTLAEHAMTGFLSGWAAVDPEGAVDFMLGHQNDPAAVRALPNAMGLVVQLADRQTTLDVLDRVAEAGDIDSVAASRVLDFVATSYPEAAVRLAERISDDGLREHNLSMALSRWVQEDFASATAYFERLHGSREKVEALRHMSYRTLRREDGGERLSRWIKAIPPGADRAEAVEMLLSAAEPSRDSLSAGYARTLQQLAAQTAGLSEDARARAAKLSGSAAPAE